MRKIYTVGFGFSYSRWMEGKPVRDMEDADLVVFTGGEDINPELYNKASHPYTHYNSRRDAFEVEEFKRARELGKKIIGICRGAQLLCAMAGGTLVQHSSHPFVHFISTNKKTKIGVNSLHHQRQYPWGGSQPKFELIGWCRLSKYNEGENEADDMSGKPDVEIVRYPDIDALAIQSHPEMICPAMVEWERESIAFCRQILNEHMEAR